MLLEQSYVSTLGCSSAFAKNMSSMSWPSDSESSDKDKELIELPLVVMDALKKYIAVEVCKKQLPMSREYYQDYVTYFKMGGFYVEMYASEAPLGEEKNTMSRQSMRLPIMLDCTNMVQDMDYHDTFKEEVFAGIYEMQLELVTRHVAELKDHMLQQLREEDSLVLTRRRGDAVVYVSPSLFACINSRANRVAEQGRYNEYYMTRGMSVTRCLREHATEDDINMCFRCDGNEENAAEEVEWQVETFIHTRDYTEHVLMFMMGFHARLGSASSEDMRDMDTDVVRHSIAPLLFNPSVQVLRNEDARAMVNRRIAQPADCAI